MAAGLIISGSMKSELNGKQNKLWKKEFNATNLKEKWWLELKSIKLSAVKGLRFIENFKFSHIFEQCVS